MGQESGLDVASGPIEARPKPSVFRRVLVGMLAMIGGMVS
jgi:hypothetical protein